MKEICFWYAKTFDGKGYCCLTDMYLSPEACTACPEFEEDDEVDEHICTLKVTVNNL